MSRGPFYTCCKKQIRQHKLISPHPCLRVILTPTTTTTIYGSPDLVVHLQSPLFISTHEGKLQSRGGRELWNPKFTAYVVNAWGSGHPAPPLPSPGWSTSKFWCPVQQKAMFVYLDWSVFHSFLAAPPENSRDLQYPHKLGSSWVPGILPGRGRSCP